MQEPIRKDVTSETMKSEAELSSSTLTGFATIETVSPSLWIVRFSSREAAIKAIDSFWKIVGSNSVLKELERLKGVDRLQELSDRGMDLRTGTISRSLSIPFKSVSGNPLSAKAIQWLESQNFNIASE